MMTCVLMCERVGSTLLELSPSAGEQFGVVALSFDPSQGADLAKAKKAHYLKAYVRGPAGAVSMFSKGACQGDNR